MCIRSLEESKGKDEAEKRQAEPSCFWIASLTLLSFPSPTLMGVVFESPISRKSLLCCLVYPARRKTEVVHMISVVSDLYLCILHVIILKWFASIWAFYCKREKKRLLTLFALENLSTYELHLKTGSRFSVILYILTFYHPWETQWYLSAKL